MDRFYCISGHISYSPIISRYQTWLNSLFWLDISDFPIDWELPNRPPQIRPIGHFPTPSYLESTPPLSSGLAELIPQLIDFGLYSATKTDHHTDSPAPMRATALSDSMLGALLFVGLAGHRREGAL